jgi:hypothetical protein
MFVVSLQILLTLALDGSVQLHASAALPILLEDGLASEPVWTQKLEDI